MGLRQSRRATRDIQIQRTDNPLYTVDINPRDAERIAMESSLAEAPLPFGWEQAICPKTSSPYFIDHLNKTTTFADPRLPDNRPKRKGRPPKYETTFYSKSQHLKARLHQIQIETEPLTITVKRDQLFSDSMELVRSFDSMTLTGRLTIKYEGEKGLDYGGMSRDWFLELSRDILNASHGLFVHRGKHFVIDPASIERPNWSQLFGFVGTILGMAVYHGKLFHSYFTSAFYKLLLGVHPDISDLKEYDEAIYKSLMYILETPNCTEDLELTFTLTEAYQSPVLPAATTNATNAHATHTANANASTNNASHTNNNGTQQTNHSNSNTNPLEATTQTHHTEKKPDIRKSTERVDKKASSATSVTPKASTQTFRVVELKPDGANIAVTESNKIEYVRLCVEHYLCGISPQMNALKENFYLFCPKDILEEIFTWSDLPEVIGGTSVVDIEDMRQWCEYKGYTANSPVVQWFWEIVQSMSQDDLRLLLRFVTGTDKVPIGGFEHLYGSNGLQKFTLNKLSKRNGLPAAHSCFNRLDLPEYSEKATLKESLLYAIRESKTFDIE